MNIAGFVIAISTLITLVMAARGWETCTSVPLNDIGTDIIFIYTAPVQPLNTGCYIANHLFAYPFNQTLLAEIEQVPNVECAVPILMHRLRAMVFTGIDPTQTITNAVKPSDVIEGRYLKADDGYVALVDKEYALLNNLTLGSTVSYAANYTVVGIVEVSATNLIKSHIYVNLPVVQEVLPEKPAVLLCTRRTCLLFCSRFFTRRPCRRPGTVSCPWQRAGSCLPARGNRPVFPPGSGRPPR